MLRREKRKTATNVVNKTHTTDRNIYSQYLKVQESTDEEGMGPEYRKRSDEAPTPGEHDESHGGSEGEVEVYAVHVVGDKIEDSAEITAGEWCPECCINALLEHEGEEKLTADDMDREYTVASDDHTIFIMKNDHDVHYIFIKQ